MPKLPDNGKNTVALIAGSFRPPNHNQWKMIQYYSDMCDHVVVLVSDPQNKKTKHAYADGREATAESSVNILKVFAKDADADNVGIMVSPIPSPVRAVYGVVAGDYINIVGDYSGWNAIIGSFKDPENWARWERVEPFATAVNLLDTKKYSYPRSYSASKVVSAIQRRDKGTKLENDADALPPFLSNDAKAEVLSMIGWDDVDAVDAGVMYLDKESEEKAKKAKQDKKDRSDKAHVQTAIDDTDITITYDGEVAVIDENLANFGNLIPDNIKSFKDDNTIDVYKMESKLSDEVKKWIEKQINDGKFDHLIIEDDEDMKKDEEETEEVVEESVIEEANESDYYKNQLDKLDEEPNEFEIKVKFVGSASKHQTNYMDLNAESIPAIIDYLENLYEKWYYSKV